jgi:predicted esterase
MWRLKISLCLAVLVGLAPWATRAPAGEVDQETAGKFVQLERELAQAFQDKKYEAAAEKCRAQIELLPNRSDPHYNLACSLARQGKKDEAFASLTKAAEFGYADAAHMQEDDDLATLRDDERFAQLTQKITAKEKTASYEKGAEIKGLKTVEDYPEGGLRYRLRLAEDASAEKPNRLVIWLHPSGGSMNNVFEGLAPLFVKHGFATLVLTRKQWMGWNDTDANKLLNKTLPAVAKVRGIDARRPLLMGYSAGGQLALQLWALAPGKFGGMILDAAYPIDMEKYQRGQQGVQPLPKDDAVKKTPIFVLVGSKDGGAQLWKQVEKEWQDAGVPLAIHRIAEKGHTWLFGQKEVAELEKWLEANAGEKLDPARENK